MTRLIAWMCIAASAIFLYAPEASAQLFGQRNVGQPLNRQTTPPRGNQTGGAAGRAKEPPTGLVDETARFIRGNREVTDFVGADRREGGQFVGRQQAGVGAEEIRSAVEELALPAATDANQVALPVMPPRVQLYPPRLKVAFPFAAAGAGEVNARLTRQLELSLPADASNRIEVSVAGNAAILRGVVASERDRKLAELLLQFEPGIGRVENQLQIESEAPPSASPPRSPG